ncbi:hypothetical protein ACH5AL_06305 [Actinacidiphila glaucinigra]|uniref:hypothetical protein n=1 Tax=Actinacidiphila glaucinigra TaxID=235986 RepID=UPI0037923F40
MTRAISLHDVSKTYGRGVRAVERFSLDIAPGKFLVLLGPSGVRPGQDGRTGPAAAAGDRAARRRER